MINESLIRNVQRYREQNPNAGRKTIAKHFGISVQQARAVLRRLGVKECAKEYAKPVAGDSLEEDLATARLENREAEAKRATDRYKTLLRRAAVEQDIVEEFTTTARSALAEGRLNIVIPPAPPVVKGGGSDEEAVLVISDSHVGKLVTPEHTLGFGHYNPRIFLNRLAYMEETVSRLLRENVANPVSRLNILFLGDLVEGALNHGEEIPNRWLVADQVLLASLAFYQFVARLSRAVPHVVCRGLGGNHARWQNQRKVPTANRYSNFDFIVLGQIQALINAAGPGNASFHLDEGAFQVFDLLDWRFKVAHGDHLKGGDRALGTPSHSIAREINATTQRYNSVNRHAPDYYLVGDKHRFCGAATATGRYLINGAWFSDDEYALHENFTPCRPFQMFFGVHERHGRSWAYDLNLDLPGADGLATYNLPERLVKKLQAYAR